MSPLALAGSVALLLANGFFVGAEFALIAARRSRIETLAATGSRRARAASSSVKELSLMLAGAQLGITMASLGLGALAEPAVARVIEGPLHAAGLPESALHTTAFLIALTIVVFLHMVIGEMAPKNIAIAEPERSALWIALPFRAFVTVFRPFISVLNWLANGGIRLLGIEPKDELAGIRDVQQIRLLIGQSAREGELGELQHRLLAGAIDFADRDAASLMVPRTDIVAVPVATSAEDVEAIVVESGHSRIPVYLEDLDHVIGFVHSKDLLTIKGADRTKPIPRRLVRPMLVVPESRKLHPLLVDMRRERRHFALVVDEHGGSAGIVTLEDLIEEIVGEIRDEHDLGETGIEDLGGGRFDVPGALPLHEADEGLGLQLPDGDYETVAGFLMDRLGRIPRPRDVIEHDGWRLRVGAMDRRRVVRVVVEKISPTKRSER